MSMVRLVGLVAALAAGLVLSRTGLMWAFAPVLAVVVLVAVLISELARPRPERQRDAGAALEVRRVRDYVRRGPLVAGLALTVLLLLELWMLSMFRDSDYFVLHGAFDWTVAFAPWANESVTIGGVVGTVVTALVVPLAAAAIVWSTVRSPRAGTDESTRDRDERWRRGVVETVVAAAGWVIATLLALWNIALVFGSPAIDATTSTNDVVVALVVAIFAATGVGGATAYGAALLRSPDR